MHTDKIIFSLIDTCRAANEKWMIEIEQDNPEEPSLGRGGPPSLCDLFLDSCEALELAVPRTMPGWLAKWQQVVSVETQYDFDCADYNLSIAQRMLAEYGLLEVKAVA
jgi:hypothetical protein